MGWNSSAVFTVECLIAQTRSESGLIVIHVPASVRQWGGRDCCASNWGEGSGVETADGL